MDNEGAIIHRILQSLGRGVLIGVLLLGPFLLEAFYAWPLTFWLAGAVAADHFLYRWPRWRNLVIGLLTFFELALLWVFRLDARGLRAVGVLTYVLATLSGLFLIHLAGLASFVLPARTWRERWETLTRLCLYLLGRHGPALSVRNGRLVSGSGEAQRRGPGLVLVDTHSAAVIERRPAKRPPARDSRPAVRIVGAGLAFLGADEAVRGLDCLDLRLQNRKANGVRGLTADGVEVEANLSVTFRLTPPPRLHWLEPAHAPAGAGRLPIRLHGADFAPGAVVKWNGRLRDTIFFSNQELRVVLRADDLNQYGRAAVTVANPPTEGGESEPVSFHIHAPGEAPPHSSATRRRPAFPLSQTAAFDAVYGQAAGDGGRVRWTEMPLLVAREVFRELLASEQVDVLFNPEAPRLAQFGQTFQDRIIAAALLKERGIRVLNASASGFRFPAEAGSPDGGVKGVSQQWLTRWLAQQRFEEHRVRAADEFIASRTRAGAFVQAHGEWAKTVAERLAAAGDNAEARRQAALLLFQMLGQAASDAARRRLLPDDVIKLLGNAQEWFLKDDDARATAP